MNSLRKLLLLVLFIGGFFLYQNCSPVNFGTSRESSSVKGDGTDAEIDDGNTHQNCRTVLDTLKTPIELIFVVDASSSNKSTDPDKSVRAGSIDQFYQLYKSKTNFSWDVISFAGSTATVRARASTAQSVEDFISWLYAYPHDVKGTPYDAALSGTSDLIKADPHPSADKKYAVVFLSDGRPSGSDSDSYWASKVTQLISVVAGRISFNTIYYGGDNAEASGLLKAMAIAGGGNFLDTNKNPTGKVFNIADTVVVPGEVCE